MKKKNIIIIAGAIFVIGISAIIGIGLLGDKPQTKQDIESLIQKNEMIEIEIAVPEDNEQGTVKTIEWTILAEIDTYQTTLRTPFEKLFYVTVNAETGEKTGRPYFNANGINLQNNTFVNACKNKMFNQMLKQNDVIEELSDIACNTYADLDAEDTYTNAMMAINGYFNLLPDTEEGYCNPNSTLTRAEFLSLMMRADTPVDATLTVNSDFKTAVGDSEHNLYAQEVEKYSYLNLSDKSLNNQTYNGTISRAEVIHYMVMRYYADWLAKLDMTKDNVEFTDAVNGGDIAKEQGFDGKNYSTSYELVWAINNPDAGLPEELYKSLLVAAKVGLINPKSDVRWDEGITKAECIEMLFDMASNEFTLTESDREGSGVGQDGLGNPAYFDETGMFDQGWEESGLTFDEDAADGYVGFTVVTHEDGTSHLVYNKDGSVYYPGDLMPNGRVYPGNEKDIEIETQKIIDAMLQWQEKNGLN